MNPAAPPSLARAQRAWNKVRQELLDLRHPQGHWVGQLSSSALATATAVSALGQYRQHSLHPILPESRINELIDKGCRWLLAQQNHDGGWGDTDDSYSNVATTMLVIAALTLAGHSQPPADIPAVVSANRYLDKKG
ncbi:MAG: prenyltransferase/squalene oxidase repeat-containing protein, partial [Pirellulaceae bacterium]|nr:prenyltransferase/squalene oxidase repeat-containing protein [Pirellulaceae bacterium]